MLPPQTFYTQVVHEKGQKLQIWTWAPYRVQCPCLKSQHQLSWILLTFATAIMGTLSKTVRFPLYPSQWVMRSSVSCRVSASDHWNLPLDADGAFPAANSLNLTPVSVSFVTMSASTSTGTSSGPCDWWLSSSLACK